MNYATHSETSLTFSPLLSCVLLGTLFLINLINANLGSRMSQQSCNMMNLPQQFQRWGWYSVEIKVKGPLKTVRIVWSKYEKYTPNREQIATKGFFAFSGCTRYMK